MSKHIISTNVKYFIQFISEIRTEKAGNIPDSSERLRAKIAILIHDTDALFTFQANCKSLLLESNIEDLFYNNIGLYSSDNLVQQLFKDIKHKILPALEDKNSINFKLNEIFYKKNDFEWVFSIPDELWLELLNLSGITNAFIQEHFQKTLYNMFMVLSYNIASLGFDEELSSRFLINGEITSPFIQQNKEVTSYIDDLENNILSEEERQHNLSHILVMLNQCHENIENIRKNTLIYGTSLKQSYLLNRIENKITRLKILVDIVDAKEFESNRFINFLKEIIYNNNKRNNIGFLLSKNIGYLAYQIAEHKGKAGEHYITSDRQEYFSFFKSAFGGGIVIAFLVLIKTGISNLQLPDFWIAMLYSLNYGLGFVFIHLAGFSVATKQPAMTASSLAKELDNNKNINSSLNSVAMLIAKVSRSQLIAVLGNLLAVFPATLLLAFLFDTISGQKILSNEHATGHLYEIHPLHSLCWWYGAIAGFYLFLTGIVAGYFDNAVIYSKIPERIRQHPKLQNVFSSATIEKTAAYLDQNMGAIMGNIIIGFFLGTASFIGNTLGIPFDIRHVTFSTGIFATSLQSLSFDINITTLLWIFAGISGIGFFNIAVSFGMAFYIALKSRNIKFSELSALPRLIFKYFRKYPLDFFFPPNRERNEEDIYIP